MGFTCVPFSKNSHNDIILTLVLRVFGAAIMPDMKIYSLDIFHFFFWLSHKAYKDALAI